MVGDKIGRIHLGRQDLNELQSRKMKGLKRGRDVNEDEDEVVDVNGQTDEDMISEDDIVDDESGDEEGGVQIKRQKLA